MSFLGDRIRWQDKRITASLSSDWAGLGWHPGKELSLCVVKFVTGEGREVNWLGSFVSEQTKITLLVSWIISDTVSTGTGEK